MTAQIAAILAIDGIATGAIYVLMALGFVLIFSVTRIVFIPFGDIAAFTALTLAALEARQFPGTVGMVAVLAVIATVMELITILRAGAYDKIPRTIFYYLLLPLIPAAVAWLTSGTLLPTAPRILLAIALILPVSPLLYRVVFLLIVSVALHFALAGLGLLFFGPEGVRTRTLTDFSLMFAGVPISGESILIVAAAAVFCLMLYLFFDFTLYGKALQATAMNRTGARLMGIRPAQAGAIAFLSGSVLAAISGVLIAPVNTIFYDSGFIIGLKAFVGAIIGGLVSFPITAIGSLFVGVLQS